MKPGLARIFLDIGREFLEVRLAADEMVEILALPERSRSAQQAIGAMRGIRLPGMKDVFQTVRLVRGKQGVRMVGHHAPSEKIVSLAVKLPERVGDSPRDARITHVAFAERIVEGALRFLDQSAKLAGAVLVGGNGRVRSHGTFDGFALRPKEIDQFARQRVRKPESNEVNGTLAFPMGKIAARANGDGWVHRWNRLHKAEGTN